MDRPAQPSRHALLHIPKLNQACQTTGLSGEHTATTAAANCASKTEIVCPRGRHPTWQQLGPPSPHAELQQQQQQQSQERAAPRL